MTQPPFSSGKFYKNDVIERKKKTTKIGKISFAELVLNQIGQVKRRSVSETSKDSFSKGSYPTGRHTHPTKKEEGGGFSQNFKKRSLPTLLFIFMILHVRPLQHSTPKSESLSE
ncbi:hypothetical protein RUM44_004969 [Polyplax serrata]|uniref:Uncharacterized protein n=1 Tax=Polyplax serrata TaxID=468196 RepID=A0ABR1AWY3_POLSC